MNYCKIFVIKINNSIKYNDNNITINNDNNYNNNDNINDLNDNLDDELELQDNISFKVVDTTRDNNIETIINDNTNNINFKTRSLEYKPNIYNNFIHHKKAISGTGITGKHNLYYITLTYYYLDFPVSKNKNDYQYDNHTIYTKHIEDNISHISEFEVNNRKLSSYFNNNNETNKNEEKIEVNKESYKCNSIDVNMSNNLNQNSINSISLKDQYSYYKNKNKSKSHDKKILIKNERKFKNKHDNLNLDHLVVDQIKTDRLLLRDNDKETKNNSEDFTTFFNYNGEKLYKNFFYYPFDTDEFFPDQVIYSLTINGRICFICCLICESFHNPEQIYFGECKHSFCLRCLKQFIEKKYESIKDRKDSKDSKDIKSSKDITQIAIKCPIFSCQTPIDSESLSKLKISLANDKEMELTKNFDIYENDKEKSSKIEPVLNSINRFQSEGNILIAVKTMCTEKNAIEIDNGDDEIFKNAQMNKGILCVHCGEPALFEAKLGELKCLNCYEWTCKYCMKPYTTGHFEFANINYCRIFFKFERTYDLESLNRKLRMRIGAEFAIVLFSYVFFVLGLLNNIYRTLTKSFGINEMNDMTNRNDINIADNKNNLSKTKLPNKRICSFFVLYLVLIIISVFALLFCILVIPFFPIMVIIYK